MAGLPRTGREQTEPNVTTSREPRRSATVAETLSVCPRSTDWQSFVVATPGTGGRPVSLRRQQNYWAKGAWVLRIVVLPVARCWVCISPDRATNVMMATQRAQWRLGYR
jgi:hypothetical protein